VQATLSIAALQELELIQPVTTDIEINGLLFPTVKKYRWNGENCMRMMQYGKEPMWKPSKQAKYLNFEQIN